MRLGGPARRDRGHAQVVGQILDPDMRLAVLGAKPIRDIEPGQNLDA